MKRILFFLYFVIALSSMALAQNMKWNRNPVIAHRGAWKLNKLPENSIASLKQAIKLGCYGSEFDVHMTADSILVVNHDPDFQGINIETATYKDLLVKRLSNGEKIPTLNSYLKTGIKQKGTKLILEIKASVISKERSLALAAKCVEMVKKLKAEPWVEYISFDYDVLKKVRELQQEAKGAYLTGDVNAEQIKKDGFAGVDYHFSVYKKGNWFEEVKQHGITLNAWTVNKAEDMQWLLDNKADFITTNEPELLFSLIKKARVGDKWKLKWADEFTKNGLPDSNNWTYDVGGHGWGNNELQYYTQADRNNANVENGALNIITRKEDKGGRKYTSARLVSKNKFDWKYGRVDVRAILPKGRGLWPAIWMLPTQWKYGGWPKSGEIDIMEHVGFKPDTVFGSIHTEKFNHVRGTQITKGIKIKDPYTEYHIYSVVWTPDKIDFLIDEQLYLSFGNSKKDSSEWPFDQDFHLILNIAVGGNWGGLKGIDDSAFPSAMKIDYVRIFQKE